MSAESPHYQYAKYLVDRYFKMLTVGCGKPKCTHRWCGLDMEPNAAAAKSLLMSLHGTEYFCDADLTSRSASPEENEVEETKSSSTPREPPRSTQRRKLVRALLLDQSISGCTRTERRSSSFRHRNSRRRSGEISNNNARK